MYVVVHLVNEEHEHGPIHLRYIYSYSLNTRYWKDPKSPALSLPTGLISMNVTLLLTYEGGQGALSTTVSKVLTTEGLGVAAAI